MKNSALIITSICASLILSACDTVPLFGHVSTSGNKIESDNGTTYDGRMQSGYCPPDQSPQRSC